jgi:DNA-binding XRE family transcriptional regulator
MSDSAPIQSTKEFGAQLRARRKELRESQGKVADLIGVNRRVLGQLERGKATVQLQIALEAARVLGLDIELAPRG